MKVDVIIHANEATTERVMHRTVAVIDVFRATSVIIEALKNGARGVVPVVTIEQAVEMKSKFSSKEIMLGGERNTRLIEGFDKDNSPLAYKREDVAGKTIIFTTTNGTRAINNSRHASSIYIAAFINMKAVCDKMASLGHDIVLVCSGREDNYTAEDGLCAGAMTQYLVDSYEYSTTDIAQVMQQMYCAASGNLTRALSTTQHYQDISARGYTDDINFCLQHNIYNIAPYYDMTTGEIKL